MPNSLVLLYAIVCILNEQLVPSAQIAKTTDSGDFKHKLVNKRVKESTEFLRYPFLKNYVTALESQLDPEVRQEIPKPRVIKRRKCFCQDVFYKKDIRDNRGVILPGFGRRRRKFTSPYGIFIKNFNVYSPPSMEGDVNFGESEMTTRRERIFPEYSGQMKRREDNKDDIMMAPDLLAASQKAVHKSAEQLETNDGVMKPLKSGKLPQDDDSLAVATSHLSNVAKRLQNLLQFLTVTEQPKIKRQLSKDLVGDDSLETEATMTKENLKEDLPCSLLGSWNSEAAGMRIDIAPLSNSRIRVRLAERTPKKRMLPGFMGDTRWDMTGLIPFARGGLIVLTAIHKDDNHAAAFIGECKSCANSEMVSGQWLLGRRSRSCRDERLSQDLLGDVWIRDTLHMYSDSRKFANITSTTPKGRI